MNTTNEQLQLLLTPKSCEVSEVDGTQRLKSGEEVYCYQGWQVSWRKWIYLTKKILIWM